MPGYEWRLCVGCFEPTTGGMHIGGRTLPLCDTCCDAVMDYHDGINGFAYDAVGMRLQGEIAPLQVN